MIEVTVFATQLDFQKNHSALRRRFEFGTIQVPFESIIRSMHCLYGDTCVIQFVVL